MGKGGETGGSGREEGRRKWRKEEREMRLGGSRMWRKSGEIRGDRDKYSRKRGGKERRRILPSGVQGVPHGKRL